MQCMNKIVQDDKDTPDIRTFVISENQHIMYSPRSVESRRPVKVTITTPQTSSTSMVASLSNHQQQDRTGNQLATKTLIKQCENEPPVQAQEVHVIRDGRFYDHHHNHATPPHLAQNSVHLSLVPSSSISSELSIRNVDSRCSDGNSNRPPLPLHHQSANTIILDAPPHSTVSSTKPHLMVVQQHHLQQQQQHHVTSMQPPPPPPPPGNAINNSPGGNGIIPKMKGSLEEPSSSMPDLGNSKNSPERCDCAEARLFYFISPTLLNATQ
ncbi:E75 C [Culex quinquefasciatus]|uniref:E75 C n=1 Tax=Culex quinquefasciatus TaxID=7176 RepID=B0WMI2_CULQU|nr:E75 C [Culex quinquefasciatus]|eukprot:XP_001849916.1 E75 C [Culex quinquefasciatus]